MAYPLLAAHLTATSSGGVGRRSGSSPERQWPGSNGWSGTSAPGRTRKTDPWQVDYGRVTPLLVKAAQEQQAEIESLKADNAALKRDIEELRSAIGSRR